MPRHYYPFILALWAVQALLVALVQGQPLFWDSVLLSGQIPTALWQKRIANPWLPPELAGYPPLWGAYLAQGWLWLGRGLAVTHWLMLPILWGISFQTVRVAQIFLPRRDLYLSCVVLLCLPPLLAQQAQCGPDLALVWLWLTALSAILRRNRGWLGLAAVGLALLSPRGAFSLLPLFLVDQVLLGPRPFAFRWLWAVSKALTFLPALVVATAWYILQHQHYGWWFTDPAGPWAGLAAYTTPLEYLRQLGICAWRLVDMGQFGVWLPLAGLVAAILLRRAPEAQHRTALALLTGVTTLSFCVFFASFRNPIGHRYLILPGLMATLWLCYEWGQALRYDRFAARLWVLLLLFGTGHFYVALYPQSWAKGWDATLLHLQGTQLKTSLITYLNDNHIAPRHIGTAFPDDGPPGAALLSDDRRLFAPFDTARCPYVLTSNLSNEQDPALEAALTRRYQKPQLELERWPVYYRLWRLRPVPDALEE